MLGRRLAKRREALSRRRSVALFLFFAVSTFGTGFSVWAAENGATSNAEESFVNVEGGTLHYQECGTGTFAVVLIHDGIADSAVWDEVWPEFCKHFHTIRYDRRGYGKTAEAKTWYYETDDLLALLREGGIRQTVLVGSSHGGGLSIDFTLAHPDLVAQLVLVGAVVSGLPYSDYFLDRGMRNNKVFKEQGVQAGLANWSKDRYLLDPSHVEAQKRLLTILTASPQDLTHNDYARATQPALPRLHEIRVPTLILTGDADIPDVHVHAGAIEAGIPGSRLVVVPEAGHLMYLEKPDEFNHTVIPFIESNISRAH